MLVRLATPVRVPDPEVLTTETGMAESSNWPLPRLPK